MNDWFRSWHGAPTDPKWLLIAKRAGTAPGIVSAVVWALFDHASQCQDRGSVADFDTETYATFSGFDEEQVEAIVHELTAKGVIVDGYLSAWNKRQPKREDNSAERAKEWRERNRTQPNATEQPRTQTNTDKIREDKIRIEDKDAAPSGPALSIVPVSTPELRKADLYNRGKELLGKTGSGLITNLLKAKGNSVELARAALEQASITSDPRSYIGAIINKRDGPGDLRARGEAW